MDNLSCWKIWQCINKVEIHFLSCICPTTPPLSTTVLTRGWTVLTVTCKATLKDNQGSPSHESWDGLPPPPHPPRDHDKDKWKKWMDGWTFCWFRRNYLAWCVTKTTDISTVVQTSELTWSRYRCSWRESSRWTWWCDSYHRGSPAGCGSFCCHGTAREISAGQSKDDERGSRNVRQERGLEEDRRKTWKDQQNQATQSKRIAWRMIFFFPDFLLILQRFIISNQALQFGFLTRTETGRWVVSADWLCRIQIIW